MLPNVLKHVLSRQVVAVFEAKRWTHIECHLQDKLGNHAAEAEDFVAAARHFAGTLLAPAPHPARQRTLLQQFLSTLRQLSPEQVISLIKSQHTALPEHIIAEKMKLAQAYCRHAYS